MTTLNVNLSEHLRLFVEKRAAEMGYADPADYVESLVAREEQRDQALADLEAKILEGLEGEAIEVTDEYIERKRAELVRRHQHSSGNGNDR